MTRQQKNDLIMKCLSKRRDIDIERAYLLADMAIQGEYPPGDSFSDDEQMIWIDYRLIVAKYLSSETEDSTET